MTDAKLICGLPKKYSPTCQQAPIARPHESTTGTLLQGVPLFTIDVKYTDKEKGFVVSAFEYRYDSNPLADSAGIRVKVNKNRKPRAIAQTP